MERREVNRDEPHARLDQPASQQAALAVGCPAVIVTRLVGLTREIKGFPDLGRRQHRQGARVKGVDALRGFGPAHEIGLGVDQLLKPPAIVQAAHRKPLRKAQLGEPKIGPVRVLADEEGVKRLAQKAGVLARSHAAVA